ncbi:carboxylic ester hydrolase [Branchiostoma belcheri]|nr:carboxylic ester hydrolase [Branchiostoma belcheri]
MSVLLVGLLTVAAVLWVLKSLFTWRYSFTREDGIQEPAEIQRDLLTGKVFIDIASVVEFFGLTTTLRLQRALDRILLSKRPKDPAIIITDTAFSGVKVRLYEPKDKQNGGRLPGLIYYHGGGWCTQDVGIKDVTSKALETWWNHQQASFQVDRTS